MSAERVPPLGSLSDRVQLRRRETGTQPEGGHELVFVPVATLWARVRRISERTAESADGRNVVVTHAVVLRFRTDVSPGDRFVHRGRALEVLSAADLNGRRAFLSCTCAEAAVTG